MTEGRVPLVAGNWKMNGLRPSLGEIAAIAQSPAAAQSLADIVICPPSTLLMAAADICKGSRIHLGGQDCHADASGAHTGDLSAEMLADTGATYVILGHSERRADHGEPNESVQAKSLAAVRAGLIPIICVGETLAEREAGSAMPVVGHQLRGSVPVNSDAQKLVIAYEPVWAIGTGVVPTPEDVAKMHAFIRQELNIHLAGQAASVRILYGGSVKPDNAMQLAAIDHVDGMLVGGASLKSADFLQILKVYN